MAKKKNKKRFRAVDVWRTSFGPISVKAVFDVYSQKFNVEPREMSNRKYTFSYCINKLRLLDDPDYKEPENQISHNI